MHLLCREYDKVEVEVEVEVEVKANTKDRCKQLDKIVISKTARLQDSKTARLRNNILKLGINRYHINIHYK
jgi:ribosomal protein L19